MYFAERIEPPPDGGGGFVAGLIFQKGANLRCGCGEGGVLSVLTPGNIGLNIGLIGAHGGVSICTIEGFQCRFPVLHVGTFLQ